MSLPKREDPNGNLIGKGATSSTAFGPGARSPLRSTPCETDRSVEEWPFEGHAKQIESRRALAPVVDFLYGVLPRSREIT